MIDETLELSHDLAVTIRAYLSLTEDGLAAPALRERLEWLLYELSKRNI